MTQTPILINDIYNSRKTLLELMKKQGYNVSDFENFDVNEVNIMRQNNQLDLILEKNSDKSSTENIVSPKIYIRYYLTKLLRPANIHDMIEDLFTLEEILTKNDILFIITKDEANETLMNELKQIWEAEGIYIVIEPMKRLQFNILNHSFVPEHIKLTAKELEDILKKYNINDKNQLPQISRFDPVARAICLRPSEVCLIKRPSKTAIESNYYRVCIN
jgi:DNA-directed RNA polymerase subunit H (RpoH/RPB5)